MIHITYNTLLAKMYTKPNYLYVQQKGQDSKKNRDILVIVYARKIILNFQTCIQSILIYIHSIPQYGRKPLSSPFGNFSSQTHINHYGLQKPTTPQEVQSGYDNLSASRPRRSQS